MRIILKQSPTRSIKNGTKIRGDKLKVLVVTGIEELEREIQLSEEHNVCISSDERYEYLLENLQYIEDQIERENFDAAIINRYLDESDDGEDIVAIFRRIKSRRPDFLLILILIDYDEDVVFPLVNAGIYNLIINENISASSILNAIDKPAKDFDFSKYQVVEESGSKINISIPTFGAKEKWKSKKVLTVYSPYSKGASNCAIELARILSTKSDKVCLVDFDYLRPSIKEKLSLKSTQGLKEAIELARQKNLFAKNIHTVLDRKDNYYVMTGLYDLNEINYVQKSYFERIIEVLKSSFEFIIIDVHSYYDLISNFVAFSKSDIVYTITTGDRDILANTMRYIKMFNEYEDVRLGVIRVIVNNYGGNDLTSIEIENMIDEPVYYLPTKEGGIFKGRSKRKYENSLKNIINEL